jgi:MtN3 and saliva related transmembrane protein
MDNIGYIATILLNTALLPQAIKSFRTKSTGDISLWWAIQFNVGLAVWVVYGFLIGNRPLIYGTSFELVLSLAVMVAKIRFKKGR